LLRLSLSWGPPANLSRKQLKEKSRRRVLGTPLARREGCAKERRGEDLQAASTLHFKPSERLHQVLWDAAELFTTPV